MPAEWFYNKNGQQLGPVSMDDLKQLAATGQLSPSDMVWRQGMGHWTRAGIVKGIFAATAEPGTTAAPPPPGSGLAPAAPAVATHVLSQPGGSMPPPSPYQQPQPAFAGGPAPGATPMLDYVTGASARAGSALAGFPAGTGSRDEWPLSPHHLAQLQLAESHRKPIRTLAGLLRALFLLSIILGFVFFFMALGMNFGTRGGGPQVAFIWIAFGIVAALCVLYYFAAKATMKCQSWGALVMIVLMSLAIVLNMVSAAIHSQGIRGNGTEIATAAMGSIIPLLVLIVSIKAYTTIPKFLASPLWCQEALVSAKL